MQRAAWRLSIVALAALVIGLLPATAAEAQISFGPCHETNDFACGRLVVPIDPSGQTPGTITLAIRRHRAPVGDGHDAVIALAGGPGQPANPFAEGFTLLLGPILSTRDLVVFDQRGTGNSHGLKCPVLNRRSEPESQAIAKCAQEIGPTRAFYTTAASVADIEAIRQAGGYDKLVLYGTSYGTKVAERYAQDHPDRVEALVLDSVVGPNGPNQLDLPTFAAIPRVLNQLCAARACLHITAHPTTDLARLLEHMRHKRLRGRVIDGHGRGHTLAVFPDDLLGMLIAGDLDPLLRIQFPAAVHSALAGDTAALARLESYAEAPSPESAEEGLDLPLYLATTCEEGQFAWNRAAAPAARLAQAVAAAHSLAPRVFAPFTAANALDLSDVRACSYWPFATPAPVLDQAPLPAVPTLILSGADDLRTPTAGARELAAQIPGSHLLVVPHTGHSVLGTEPDSCAGDALDAMFAGKPVKQCTATHRSSLELPTPLAPSKLANVRAKRPYGGRTGRTLGAVVLTLKDFTFELALQASRQLSGLLRSTFDLRVGGLRAGWAEYSKLGLKFHRYTYVPGVSIAGTITTGRATLQIGGSAAAHGTLHLGPDETLSGILGGRRVHLSKFIAHAAIARAAIARAARHRVSPVE